MGMRREIVLSHVVKDVQNAALDALRAKDEQAHSKLEQLRAQMRGKQYAYDHTGEVTLVSVIEPHKLPKPMVAPLYKTGDGGTEQCGTGPKASEKPGALICTVRWDVLMDIGGSSLTVCQEPSAQVHVFLALV
jgi:hypothetical protein